MVVAILALDLRLEGCRSLKEKRHLLRGLIERSRRDFQVSIAEVGDQDLWGNAVVCASYSSNSSDHAHRVLDNVEHAFDTHPEIEVTSILRDLWRPAYLS